MTQRIAALLTCHNRREKTLACLDSLTGQRLDTGKLDVYLVDDGSTDGTAVAVKERFPQVTVLPGGGQLYWNGGMRLAWARAMEADYDAYLWLNDDTVLDEGAVDLLVSTWADLRERGEHRAIVAGATRDPVTGEISYSGVERRDARRPLHFSLVVPGDTAQTVDTMNGNFVLVPREVAQRVGNLEPKYRQSMGDFDYGLRAWRSGCSVWLAPGTVGTCRRNPHEPYGLSISEDLRSISNRKDVPVRPWLVFARRWAGPLWPLYFVSPYVRRSLKVAQAWLRRARGGAPTPR